MNREREFVNRSSVLVEDDDDDDKRNGKSSSLPSEGKQSRERMELER